MSTWIVLGSSPLAPQALEAARMEHDIDCLITTNAGILLEPRPTHYFLNDQVGCKTFMVQAKDAAKHGTHCIAFLREPRAMKDRGVDWFPEHLQMSRANGVEKYERNEYPAVGFSGNYCAQYACKHRATKVLLCGHDGYSNSESSHDWQGKRYRNFGASDKKCNEALRNVIQPFFRRLAVIWPEVEFVQYGRPNFQIGEPNWRVIDVHNRSNPGTRREQGDSGQESATCRR